MKKIIARKKGMYDIILILDGNKVIEEHHDGIRAKSWLGQRLTQLKEEKREIVHVIDAEPEKKPEVSRGRIIKIPMRFEEE